MSDANTDDTQTRDASPAPWTVKGMPREQRDAINAAARRADMTVAAFIWDACEAKIRADRVPIGTIGAASNTALVGPTKDDLSPISEASHALVDDLGKLTEMALLLTREELSLRAEGKKPTRVFQAASTAVIARLAGFA